VSSLEAIGYLASALVLATFCMRSMAVLRLVAIASNLAFMAYGYLGQLTPVLLLHGLLMLVNAYHIGRLVLAPAVAGGRHKSLAPARSWPRQ
jgi:CRP/FNR family transcriptional regulator, cyclic AMP receptor protein